MANGHGGRRPRAGRKPKLTTTIKERALKEANGDAEYALGLVIALMKDESLDMPIRYAAALETMDRVWGKAVQQANVKQSGAVLLRLVHDRDSRASSARAEDAPPEAA